MMGLVLARPVVRARRRARIASVVVGFVLVNVVCWIGFLWLMSL